MKNNATNMRIDEMHYDRLTLVFGEYAGKAHAPVNPAATLVAVKGGPVKNPITSALAGALESLGLARKSQPALTDAAAAAIAATGAVAAKGAAEEAIENAGLSALFSLLYNLECDVYSIVAAGLDDVAKKAAVTALATSFYEAALSLLDSIFTEKSMVIDAAQKSGTKPDADAVAKQIGVLDGVIAAATKSREALAKFVEAAPAESAPAAEPAAKSAEQIAAEAEAARKAAEVTPAAKPADAQPDMAALVAEAVKAVDFATLVGEAVKAAVAPLEAKVTEADAKLADATKAVETANAAKAAAEKALADGIGDARSRNAPGGHQDGVEAQKSGVDEAAVTTAAAAAPTILDTIKILHGSAPKAAA